MMQIMNNIKIPIIYVYGINNMFITNQSQMGNAKVQLYNLITKQMYGMELDLIHLK